MTRRAARAIGIMPLLAATCFTGEAARGLPCENDAQCGTELRCDEGICGGRSAADGATQGDSGSDSGTGTTGTIASCGPPPPVWCEGVPALGSVTFEEAVDLDVVGTAGAISAVPGYFLGDDAILDVAVANLFEQRVMLFRNEGDGRLEPVPIVYPLGLSVYDIAAGDFDCDGNTDIAAVSLESPSFLVSLGQGDGIGEFAQQGVVANAWSLAVGDFRGDDGRPDVLVAGSDNAFLLQLVDGEWDNALISYTPTATTWSVAVGDLDGDGIVDAVIPDADQYDYPMMTEDRVIVMLSGDDLEPTSYLQPDFAHPIDAALLDLDDDGDLDMAVVSKHVDAPLTSSSQRGTLTLHENDGNGTFSQIGSERTMGTGATAIAAADFDCDGITDLAVGHDGGTDGIWVLWGPAYDPDAPTLIAAGARLGTRISVADMNADGYPDLVAPGFGALDGDGVVVESSGIYVLMPREAG